MLSTGLFFLCSLLGEKSPFTFGQAEIPDESSRAQRKLDCKKSCENTEACLVSLGPWTVFQNGLIASCNTNFAVNPGGIHSRDWLRFKICDKIVRACTEKLQQGLAGLAEAAHFLQFSETADEELIQVNHSSSVCAATMYGRTFANR